MIRSIKFPEMRLEVVAALESLSNRIRQEHWGKVEDDVNHFDDLTLNVHILYDDCMVLPDPSSAVPEILHQEEVSALRDLENALGPMIRELRDLPDRAYINDSRWPTVMAAAAEALRIMRRCDEEAHA